MKTDQRGTPRVEVQAGATLQMLGISAGANGPVVAVTVVDASGRGMRLRAPVPMTAGQAVTIEIGEAIFLGEVCYCTPDADNCFYVGIVTKECLTRLASLRQLIQALTPVSSHQLEPRR